MRSPACSSSGRAKMRAGSAKRLPSNSLRTRKSRYSVNPAVARSTASSANLMKRQSFLRRAMRAFYLVDSGRILTATMLNLREIDHVVLRVRDIAAMTKFYCEVLGARHVAYRPEFGMTHLRAGTSMIDLVAVDGPL